MQFALALGTVVLVAALAASCVPVRVEGTVSVAASFDWSVRVRWAFVRFERASSRAAPRRARRKRAKRVASRRLERGGSDPRSARSRLWTDRGVWVRTVRLLRALAARVELRNLSGSIVFGLDDPADTGTIYGTLTPVLAIVAARHPRALAVTPSFAGARLDARMAGAARLVPLRIVGPLATFGWWLGWCAWRARRERA